VLITAAKVRAFLLFFFLCNTVVVYAGITIDSTHTTTSTCANNGTIAIYAHSGSTIFYAITGGPNTHPAQSGNLFASLSPGIYQILLTDLLNDSIRTTATVSGNYAAPTFSPSFWDPACPGAATGIIVGNALTTGTKPFIWELTNLSMSSITTQASDSFKNLLPGGYSLREYDSCGNFSTYSITLVAPNDSFSIVNLTNEMLACDSVRLSIVLNVSNGNYASPYTIKTQTHNGTSQHTITNIVYSGSYPLVTETVSGVSYGDYINVTITDACGRSVYKANTVASNYLKVNFNALQDSCNLKYLAYFYLPGDSSQSNVNITYFPDPVTVIVSNAVTGAGIDTLVSNDTINHSSQYAYSGAETANQNYKLTLKDGCGHVHTQIYTWPVTPPPASSKSIINLSCMDSTACMSLQWQNTFFTDPTFQLLSGPGHIGSTKPHYVYRDTILYPQSYLCNGNSNGYFIQLTNLAAGTYRYRAFDSCGNTLTDSFKVLPQDLNVDHFAVNYKKGCPGQIQISVSTDNFSYGTLSNPLTGTVNLNSPVDTLINLNVGTYIATFSYLKTAYSVQVNHNLPCQIINDTIIIPAYQAPRVSYSTQIKCHGSVFVAFLPDSTTGVAPYKYQILSGPQIVGLQRSNLFTLLLPGPYLARIIDSCGYANTFSFTVDTLSFAQIVRVGASCAGYSAYLNCEYSPYATYIWQKPNGSFYTGDSLYLNPIATADFGIYHIKKIISINGCRDTFTSTYNFMGDTITQTYASICPGQSVVFAGRTHSLAGTYYDTLHTGACDSIVALNLSIRGSVYDSVSQNICTGHSVTVGPHIYSSQGIYRDTLVTAAGCDSIHILNLHINPYALGLVSMVICPGQSLLFGGIARSGAGVYYDTVATAGCDSIITLTLSIRGPLYDSVSQTICAGHSVSSGIHSYSATGIYRDTIMTAGCDSIHVWNLQVTPYKLGSTSAVTCPGQVFSFGGRNRSAAGLYYDTIPTTGCDSIVTLHLSIRGPLYDSVSQTICAGHSVSAGSHTYTATGIYRDTIVAGGCDSIHVLDLHVTPYRAGSISAVICPGQNFSFGGILRSVSGLYYDTIPTSACDSIATLHLSIRGPLYDSASQTICAGQTVLINAHTYSATGIYRDTIVTAGCDSIHVLNLLVTPFKHGAVSAVICPGQSLPFGSASLSVSGAYYDTISTPGCDSITMLTLIVRGPLYDSVSRTICAGRSVPVGVHIYSATGSYRDTISTGGCDSIHVLSLQVLPFGRGSQATVMCPGQSILFGGMVRSVAGIYYDTIPTTGCDSIVALALSIRGPLYDSVTQTICAGQSVRVGANTYNATGIYRDTIAAGSCDSIYILNLRVTPYSRSTLSITICPGQNYLFGNASLSLPGIYYDTITTLGCDSIVSLRLTVRGPLYDSASQTICVGQSVSVWTHSYTAAGIYYDTIPTGACDSIHVLNLQVNPYRQGAMSVAICPGQSLLFGNSTLSMAGVYYDTIPTAGCDSIVTLTLTIRGPVYDSVSQNICPGQQITVGAHTYSMTGIYRDTFVTAGCDSIHILNLHAGTNGRSSMTTTICRGQALLFGRISRVVTGVYYDTIPTMGCDSIVALTLMIRGPLYDSVLQTICAGNRAIVGFHSYAATGIYRDTSVTGGCDSIHVLNLYVTPYIPRSQSANICPGQSFSAGTHIYTTSGIYADTVPGIGCDSIISTALNLISAVPTSVNINGICTKLYNGRLYTADAIVADTIVSSLGCDSIYLTAHIHISPPTDSLISRAVCIYSGQSYMIGGQPRTIAGIYSDTVRTVVGGCDSIITNTNLRVISPQYIKRQIDSCYSAVFRGMVYTQDILLRDTIPSSCGLDSIILIDSLHIYDPSIVVVSALQLPIIAGQHSRLTISPSGNYQNIIWSPDYNISNIYIISPIIYPAQDTAYYVTAEDAHHCLVSGRIEVTVAGNEQAEFLMPTAFSPNGDGNNDIYRPVIKATGNLEILSFQIFDRWGEKVFDKENTGLPGWDGTYKNTKEPIGVYVYYITVKLSSGDTVRQSGNLTLIR
jgi:gliding motility-associated-like protein